MANIYITTGKNLVVDRIDDTASGANTDYVAIGTGSGQTAASTTLAVEVETRAAATKSQPAADKNQWQGTVSITATRAITEAGIFSASSGGTLILYGDFAVINLVSGDSIQCTFTLQQT